MAGPYRHEPRHYYNTRIYTELCNRSSNIRSPPLLPHHHQIHHRILHHHQNQYSNISSSSSHGKSVDENLEDYWEDASVSLRGSWDPFSISAPSSSSPASVSSPLSSSSDTTQATTSGRNLLPPGNILPAEESCSKSPCGSSPSEGRNLLHGNILAKKEASSSSSSSSESWNLLDGNIPPKKEPSSSEGRNLLQENILAKKESSSESWNLVHGNILGKKESSSPSLESWNLVHGNILPKKESSSSSSSSSWNLLHGNVQAKKESSTSSSSSERWNLLDGNILPKKESSSSSERWNLPHGNILPKNESSTSYSSSSSSSNFEIDHKSSTNYIRVGSHGGVRSFPPPVASCVTMSIKGGGRFVLKEMDACSSPGFFRAERVDGRLRLRLIQHHNVHDNGLIGSQADEESDKNHDDEDDYEEEEDDDDDDDDELCAPTTSDDELCGPTPPDIIRSVDTGPNHDPDDPKPVSVNMALPNNSNNPRMDPQTMPMPGGVVVKPWYPKEMFQYHQSNLAHLGLAIS